MDILKKPFAILFSSAVLAFALALLFLGPAVPEARAAKVCPEIRSGNPVGSDLFPNGDKIREERKIPRSCKGTGLINEVLCAIAEFFADLSGPGKLDLKDSPMPGYLRTANELALSGDEEALLGLDPKKREEPGAITGAIAKMLIPGYTQNDRDPISALTESEAQLVTGKITLNNQALQKTFDETVYEEPDPGADPGYYDLQVGSGDEAAPQYQVEGRFGEVAPLYDRFGFLKQALMPSAGSAAIPDYDCYDPDIDYDISVIAVTGFAEQNPHRDAPWTAYREIPEGDLEGQTEECSQNEDGSYDCPSTTEGESYKAGGNLDTQSGVALVDEAWERIGAPSNNPGEGGVFNVLLLPDKSFRTDQADASLGFNYDPHSDLNNYSESAALKIAELGNVGGAVSCIVNGVTAHPARASSEICDNAFDFFAGIPVECTEEATPIPFANNSGSSVARRAWDIVNNMYQGFWCYWNWSKDDYPNIFSEEFYLKNPFPSRSEVENCSECLFWCTWLVWKTHSDHGPSLNSQGMKNYYEEKGRFVAPETANISNVRPGYVVFFQTHGGPNRLNHVGIVYSVTQDSITFVQSNAATKFDTITFNASGTGVQNLPWARVGGFGRP